MVIFFMDEVLRENFGVHQTEQGGGPMLNGLTKEAGLERTGETAVPEKILQVKIQHFDKMGEWQEERHVQVKGDLGIRKATSSESIMIEKVVKMPPVFDGVDNTPLPVHLFEVRGQALIEMNLFEELV
jgi:hypothetical protein